MRIICSCSHPKTSHRWTYGEAGKGACFLCHCSGLRPERYVLFTGERRVLAKIAETTAIGCVSLSSFLHQANDPAASAVDAICHNLYIARYVTFILGHTVSATPSGRQYLQENPLRA